MSTHLSQTPKPRARRIFTTAFCADVAMTAISYQVAAPVQAAETAVPNTQNEQSMEGMEHEDMDHSRMQSMDHERMKLEDQGAMPVMKMPADKKEQMDMDMGAMQGGKAPPDARDPDTYAEGLKSAPMHGMDMADDALFGRLLLDKFEFAHS